MGSYVKNKGRSKGNGGHFGLLKTVMNHPNFARLTANGKQFVLLLGKQYNGFNNGDLSATWKQARAFGFRSPSSLARAKEEALHYRLVTLARQGGTNKPTLYALTWEKIDPCNGKLDVKPTKTPSGEWMIEQPDFVPKSSRKKPALRVVKN